MNEKLQYAEMLEIPVNTCSITFKPTRKKRRRLKKQVDDEQIKNQLLQKVNSQTDEMDAGEAPAEDSAMAENYAEFAGIPASVESENQPSDTAADNAEAEEIYRPTVNIRRAEKKKRRVKFNVVALQLCIIGVLIATIFLTNALVPESGINTFMRGVFGVSQTEKTDERLYSDFVPNFPLEGGAASLENGVTTLAGEGSLYSPCDGTITSVEKGEDDKFILEITHSQNFKTVFSGVDYAYVSLNDKVYSNIPVGYIFGENACMCFYGKDGGLITDYSIEGSSVIWAV